MENKLLDVLQLIMMAVLCALLFWIVSPYKEQNTKEQIVQDTITIHTYKEIYDTITILQRLEESRIVEEFVIDTIESVKYDTVAILQDWLTTRKYNQTLFDLEGIGKCDIAFEVVFNRVKDLRYTLSNISTKKTRGLLGVSVLDNRLWVSAGILKDNFTGILHLSYNESPMLGASLLYNF